MLNKGHGIEKGDCCYLGSDSLIYDKNIFLHPSTVPTFIIPMHIYLEEQAYKIACIVWCKKMKG